MFFELEKIMTASNDVSFYLGRRDNHKITLSNIFPSFNDVIEIDRNNKEKFFLINFFLFIESRLNTKSTFISSRNAT